MKWSYRLVRHTPEGMESWYGMHEVHYAKNGRVLAWTENPCFVVDDPADVQVVLDMMRRAVSEPILDEQEMLARWGE